MLQHARLAYEERLGQLEVSVRVLGACRAAVENSH